MTRVVFLSFDSNLYGSERTMLDGIANIDRAEFEPLLIVVRPGPLAEAARAAGVETLELPWLAGPFSARPVAAALAIRRLSALLRERRAGIVELNRLAFGHLFVVLAAARLRGARVVVRVRMPASPLSRAQKHLLSRADRVIAVSADAVAPWRDARLPRALARRLSVVPDSRPVKALKSVPADRSLLAALGVPEGAPAVGMIARITPDKRQDLFLRAAGLVAARRPDARFVVVGARPDGKDEAYEASLRRSAAGEPLASRVIFAGQRADAPALTKNFAALVLPSDREAFGGVLIEAMALGVPIVAARAGGVPEVVEHGRTGLLVDRQEPEAYAEAILRVLDDPALAARLRAEGLAESDRFEGARIGAELGAVYRELSGRA